MYMKLIKRTYRFRLYPTTSQKELIEKTLGCSRQVYNEFLSICKKEYEKDHNYKVSKYDLIISQSPCLKIDEVSAAAIEKEKNFFVTLCNCILERYPNLVDYYYDDDNFDPIFEQLLSEMHTYNNYLENKNLQLKSGSLFYNDGEIKYFTGKKLIK